MIDRNIFIQKKDGTNLFLNILECDLHAPNVIYIQTPTGSVVDMRDSYYPLSRYGVNVFALDLTGVGKSHGNIAQFSTQTLIDDIDFCMDVIRQKYSGSIHLFGGTGTGGILGQYYVSGKNSVKSYIQYGLANYKDLRFLENPQIVKLCYPLVSWIQKWIPEWKVKFNPKSYEGLNADRENAWYCAMKKEKPQIMEMNIGLLKTLLEIMLDEGSFIKQMPSCPVLVFAPQHDRYFSKEYIQSYYNALKGPKEIYEIEDSHLSFLWRADEICKKASQWIHERS